MVTADIKTEEGRGIAIYTEELSKGLKKQDLSIDQLFYQRGSIRSFLKLVPKLKKYDITHIQLEYGLFGRFAGIKFVPLLLFLYFLGVKKIVITMHTVHDKKEKLIHKNSFWIWLRKNLIYPLQNKLIGFCADAIVLHTNFLAERMNKIYKVKKRKLFVIPHGVREDSPIIKKEMAKKILRLKGPVYLMIGNISYPKGFDIVIKKAKEIGKNIVIFGQAVGNEVAYLEDLKNYIKTNNLEKIVRIDTNIDPVGSDYKKWWLYLSSADLILLPYRTMTTSGIFISAMQAKKPVVTSDSLYFREIASKYGCIKITRTNEDYPKAIKKSMRNLKKMEKEASKFSKDNSFKVLSLKYKNLYNKLSDI